MSRPVTKAFLGNITTEIRLGPLREPLAREAEAEGLYISDLIRREIARFLQYRGHRVDQRLLDPPPIRFRFTEPLEAAATSRSG